MTVDINIKIKENSIGSNNASSDNVIILFIFLFTFIQANKYEIDLFIPTRKTFSLNLNSNENIINMLQHKVHNNKYFIISINNGNIL